MRPPWVEGPCRRQRRKLETSVEGGRFHQEGWEVSQRRRQSILKVVEGSSVREKRAGGGNPAQRRLRELWGKSGAMAMPGKCGNGGRGRGNLREIITFVTQHNYLFGRLQENLKMHFKAFLELAYFLHVSPFGPNG